MVCLFTALTERIMNLLKGRFRIEGYSAGGIQRFKIVCSAEKEGDFINAYLGR